MSYAIGDCVVGLGRRGVAWPDRPLGWVTELWNRGDGDEWVRVQWHDSAVEEDMRPDELEHAEQRPTDHPVFAAVVNLRTGQVSHVRQPLQTRPRTG